MSQTKPKKSTTPLVQCQACLTSLLQKDSELHLKDCPPSSDQPKYNYIHNKSLFGTLDLKTNEELLKVEDTDNLVFLSESIICLCGLAIGDWAVITFSDDSIAPIGKVVWPTIEKGLTNVLLTKTALDLVGAPVNSPVSVRKCETRPAAREITLAALNTPKSMEASPELITRIQKTYAGRLINVGNQLSVRFFGKLLKFEVKKIDKAENGDFESQLEGLTLATDRLHLTSERTAWKLLGNDPKAAAEETGASLLAKIGGLDFEIDEIAHSIRLALDETKPYGLRHTKSILLYGHSGTGKTMLATALGRATSAHFIHVTPASLYASSKMDETIGGLFEEAVRMAPTVILLDEVDVLCPPRSARLTDSDKRAISTILTGFERLTASRIFVLGTTNKIDGVEPSLRRSGRFEREIEICTPNPASRRAIIAILLADVTHSLSATNIASISDKTHGFVGADLVSLVNYAALSAAKAKKAEIEVDDFEVGLKVVRPSAMREVQVEVANVRWTDIGGQEALKLALRQAVEWPLRHPEAFARLGVAPPRGVLMYGPPGCSKTMIARALATESGLNFLSIKGPELFSKWVGESERAVREVFRRARQVAPAVVFFDEVDAVGGERGAGGGVQERVLAQLLTELDGVSPLGAVTVVAATNRPDRIDGALLRPGRLDRVVYVPLPDERTRGEIFRLRLAAMRVRGVEVAWLVGRTERYSGAEVSAVCAEAAMGALEESLAAECVELRHFERALERVKPRTSVDMVKLYENYLNNKNF